MNNNIYIIKEPTISAHVQSKLKDNKEENFNLESSIIKLKNNFIKYFPRKYLPTITHENNEYKISYEIPYYKYLIKKDLPFETNLLFIQKFFNAYISDEKTHEKIQKLKLNNIEKSILFSFKIKPHYELEEKINTGTYTENFRYALEILAKEYKPKTVVFIGGNRFNVEVVGFLRAYKRNLNVHIYKYLTNPLKDPIIPRKENIDNKDFYLYPQLNQGVSNLAPFSKEVPITITYSNDKIHSLIDVVEKKIIPDLIVLQNLDANFAKLIFDKLLATYENIILLIKTDNRDIKDIIVNNNYNPIYIPLNNDICRFTDNYVPTIFIITNRVYIFSKIYKYPSSFFDGYTENYSFFNELNFKKTEEMKFFYKKNLKKYNIISNEKHFKFTKKYIIEKYSNLYLKYKYELNLFEKHIKEDYLFCIFMLNTININNFFFQLFMPFTIYEAIFIYKLINEYIKKNEDKKFTIVEFGCDYGINTMLILSAIKNIKSKKFKIFNVDLEQKTKYHGVGLYNIDKIINRNNTKNELVEMYDYDSINYIKNYKRNYKISIFYIDGTKMFNNIFNNLISIHELLKLNGIIIINNVLNNNVKIQLEKFYNSYKTCYRRLCLDDNFDFIENNDIYKHFSDKKINDPNNIYALIKVC